MADAEVLLRAHTPHELTEWLTCFAGDMRKAIMSQLEDELRGAVRHEARLLVETMAGEELRRMVREAIKARINIDIVIDGVSRV